MYFSEICTDFMQTGQFRNLQFAIESLDLCISEAFLKEVRSTKTDLNRGQLYLDLICPV